MPELMWSLLPISALLLFVMIVCVSYIMLNIAMFLGLLMYWRRRRKAVRELTEEAQNLGLEY